MKIVFIHSGIEFDGDSLNRGPLGGTETALIAVSRELAKIAGNQVYIFTNTPRMEIYAGVHYFPLRELASFSREKDVDVLITIRQWVPFWFPIRAKYRVYFSPDAHDQPFLHQALSFQSVMQGHTFVIPLFSPKDFFSAVDQFFCVGSWQAQTFKDRLGFPGDKIFVTGNGVMLENFKPQAREQRQKNLLYSATPFRGLDHLVGYYRELQSKHPDLLLEVCSGMGVYGLSKTDDERQYGNLYQRLKEVCAISHGSIEQSELAKIMCHGLIYAYPNTFEETFCISVLEAQAAGLPVVTSDRGALNERIRHGEDGFLIKGHPSEEKYKKEFLEIVDHLVEDSNLWNRISANAIKTAGHQSYECVAEKWMKHFDNAVSPRKFFTSNRLPAIEDQQVSVQQPISANIHIKDVTIRNILNQYALLFGYSSLF